MMNMVDRRHDNSDSTVRTSSLVQVRLHGSFRQQHFNLAVFSEAHLAMSFSPSPRMPLRCAMRSHTLYRMLEENGMFIVESMIEDGAG